ncbi:hypothetical protein CF319_g8041, partial [Tilletia indica]
PGEEGRVTPFENPAQYSCSNAQSAAPPCGSDTSSQPILVEIEPNEDDVDIEEQDRETRSISKDPWAKVKLESTRAAKVVRIEDISDTRWMAPPTWTSSGRYPRVRGAKPLGQGTYGTVLKVVDGLSGYTRARKRQSYEDYPSSRLLFELEALSRVQRHQGIVEVLDIAYTNNSIDIIMPLYNGTLQDLLDDQEGRELAPRRSRSLSQQLISAVAHIHRHAIVHLDLKPGNIMVTRDYTLKIGDFGLSAAVGMDRQIRTLGTMGYSAPECMLGSVRPAFQNDVWSVGCIIAEMYTGRPLFSFNDDDGAIRDILRFTGHPGGPVYPAGKYPPPQYKISTNWGPFRSDADARLEDIDIRASAIIKKMLLLYPNRRPHMARFFQDPFFIMSSK